MRLYPWRIEVGAERCTITMDEHGTITVDGVVRGKLDVDGELQVDGASRATLSPGGVVRCDGHTLLLDAAGALRLDGVTLVDYAPDGRMFVLGPYDPEHGFSFHGAPTARPAATLSLLGLYARTELSFMV